MAEINDQNMPQSKFRTILREFSAKSTIHGVAYIGDQKINWIERVWWMIAFFISIIVCAYLIYEVLSTWQKDPIIYSLETKSQSIANIPFPAVSICPIVKTKTNVFNYTDVYRALLKLETPNSRNITSDELTYMKVVSQYCDYRIATPIRELFTDEYFEESISSIIEKMAPTLEETVVDCKVFGKTANCSEIFFPIITDCGLCFGFNLLNARDMFTDEVSSTISNETSKQPLSSWSLDYNYDKENVRFDSNAYPHRVYGTGTEESLILTLRNSKSDVDHLCGGGIEGFYIMLHPPNEGPQVLKKYFYLSTGKCVTLNVEPRKYLTSSDAQSHAPKSRNCYFNSERRLRFYRQYTHYNCELECLANTTLELCGCVKYSQPRANGMNICGPGHHDCVRRVDGLLYRNERIGICGCLPSCSMLTYNALASQADFKINRVVYSAVGLQPPEDLENATYGRLIVTFNDEIFHPIRRIESMTKKRSAC